MEKPMYMMMIEKSRTYNKITKKVVEEHVANIRRLDDDGKLEICGVFKGYPGMAGMYLLKVGSREETKALCDNEPLIVGGYATYKLHPFYSQHCMKNNHPWPIETLYNHKKNPPRTNGVGSFSRTQKTLA